MVGGDAGDARAGAARARGAREVDLPPRPGRLGRRDEARRQHGHLRAQRRRRGGRSSSPRRAGVTARLAYEVIAACAVGAPYVGYKRGGVPRPGRARRSRSRSTSPPRTCGLITALADRLGIPMPQAACQPRPHPDRLVRRPRRARLRHRRRGAARPRPSTRGRSAAHEEAPPTLSRPPGLTPARPRAPRDPTTRRHQRCMSRRDPMADRILIKNAIVLTQDPSIGELPRADVLVEGDRIAAVGPDLAADDAEVIDATGDIVIPGFIDTHRHTWETSIRTCAPDYTLGAYFGAILDQFAPKYRPRGRPRGEPLGRARVPQRGHHDARRLVAHHEHARPRRRGHRGPPGHRASGRCSRSASPTRRSRPGGSGPTGRARVERIDGDLARRVRQRLSDDEALITMGLATRGTNFCKPEVVRYEWELAKELGHQHHGPRRDGPLRLHEGPADGAPGPGPAVPEHDLRPRLAPHRRGVAARPRLRAATSRSRPRSSSRWATAGRRPRRPTSWASRWASAPTSRPPPRRTSSPRCTRSFAPSGACGTRSPGTRTSTATPARPT